MSADIKGFTADRLKLPHKAGNRPRMNERGDPPGQLTDQGIQSLSFPDGYKTLLNGASNMPSNKTFLLCDQHHAMWLNGAWNMNRFVVTNGQVNQVSRLIRGINSSHGGGSTMELSAACARILRKRCVPIPPFNHS
jgi:hypothetical protein